MDRSTRAWWGRFALAPDGGRRWRIGPLSLVVSRRVLEWRIAWLTGPDPFDEQLAVAVPEPPSRALEPDAEPDEAAPGWTMHRFAVQGASEATLLPALADRPVVVRPEIPFHLPGGREASVYVSTPVWVRISVGGVELADLPSFRMSDTWFGPSTRVGELCYASRTSARLRLELLPRRVSRAITEVRLVNRGPTPLVLERLKVPVPSLALYGDPVEGFWTQPLTVVRHANGATDVELAQSPARVRERVAPPREKEPLNAIARAFGAFLG